MSLDTYMLLEPNWDANFMMAYRFETNIIRAIYGYEQRSALFSWPRRTVKYDVQFNNPADSAYYTGFIANHIHEIIGVPIWAEQTLLTAQAASGTAVLNVTDTDKFNFEVGSWVFIYGGDRDTYEVGKILTLTPTQITLTANLTSTWVSGKEVYPMLSMQLEQQIPHRKYTSRVGRASLLFKETWNGDAVHVLGAHSFPGYNGYVVFDQEPNWVGNLGFSIKRLSERSVNLGVDLSYTREGESDITLNAQYMGIDADGIAELKGLFNTHMGRWKQFWLPTWQNDIVVTGAIQITDTSITVEDFNYIDNWAGNSIIGKHIFFIFPDGTHAYRKIIGWPSDTQLNLDSQVGKAVAVGDLGGLFTCFLMPARFDIEEMELNYHRVGLAETRLRMQSLHDEVMTTSTTTTTTTTTTTHTETTTT